MTGSVKQIEWASKIQSSYIRRLKAAQETAEIRVKDGDFKPEFLIAATAIVTKAVAAAEAKTDAKFWIDNRATFERFSDSEIMNAAWRASNK